MNFKEVYKKINATGKYLFSLNDLYILFPSYSEHTLRTQLYQWNRKGWIRRLKKGLYELTYPSPYNLSDFYIANVLYEPSYVSLETALSAAGVIPEFSAGVTSITTKPTREFSNYHGLFIYRSVQPKAFCGYHTEKHQDREVLVAEPEKAFADYVYFKKVDGCLDELSEERIDINGLNGRKIKEYAGLYGIKKEVIDAFL